MMEIVPLFTFFMVYLKLAWILSNKYKVPPTCFPLSSFRIMWLVTAWHLRVYFRLLHIQCFLCLRCGNGSHVCGVQSRGHHHHHRHRHRHQVCGILVCHAGEYGNFPTGCLGFNPPSCRSVLSVPGNSRYHYAVDTTITPVRCEVPAQVIRALAQVTPPVFPPVSSANTLELAFGKSDPAWLICLPDRK